MEYIFLNNQAYKTSKQPKKMEEPKKSNYKINMSSIIKTCAE
jgi:hypothetical protein